jgi:hypothetical protein
LHSPQRQGTNLRFAITPAVLGWLALEAASQNKGITELAKDLVLAVTEKDLIEEVLKK